MTTRPRPLGRPAGGAAPWAVVLAAVALVACAPSTPLAPPRLDPQVAPSLRPVTAPAPSTTAAAGVPAAVTTAPPQWGPALSADGPWRVVDAAPGVAAPGLAYELLPGLWAHLPVQEHVAEGVTWTLTAPDVPLVEAYLQARRVFYLATESSPFRLHDPGWGRWYLDGGAGFAAFLAPRDAAGEVFAREQGVVLRPVVLGEQRTDHSGIVFDCVLDGGVWRRPDGSLGADSVVGVVPTGVSTQVSLVDGRWRIGHLAAQPEACA